MARAFIFDFDGVIADSEVLSNTVLAEIVTELGVPTTVEDAYRGYMGKRFHEVIAAIENAVGRTLPPSFGVQYQNRALARFGKNLHPSRACGSSSQNSSIFLAASRRPPHQTGSPSVLRFWK